MFNINVESVKKLVSLRSQVFSEYFYSLMANHNIKSIRNGIKVLIFYCYYEIVSSHMSERGVIFRPVIALFLFCIFVTCFIATINVRNTLIMIRLSSVLVILSLAYTILLGCDVREISETHYSLTISIILLMFTLFHLKFLMTILLSFSHILVFLSTGNFSMRLLEKINISRLDEPYLVLQRAYHTRMENKKLFITGQCLLLLLILLTGLYLRFFNSVREKSAFLKLAQNAESKLNMKSAVKVQNYWIEAIMPACVKDEYMAKCNSYDIYNLVYCKKFDNVSILFADIVGFTAMSSNKTAEKMVYLLNDLYNRFDKYSKFTNCEKIGTLGDCYYCVSGCPTPRLDHAICCVEMGLGVCKLILKFNKDHKENVNMRVGIHSGKVIAAIIGKHRFRFDVFSNDVVVANSLETTGRPGMVHISEDTYLQVQHSYIFEEGDLLKIKREDEHGLGGKILNIVEIKTFFIIPHKKSHQSIRNQQNSQNNFKISKKKFRQTNFNNFLFQNQKITNNLQIIQAIKQDPERPVAFFQNPPINQISLAFNDREIENHYLYHTTDQKENLTIECIKTALFFDSLASLFFSLILIATIFIMLGEKLSTMIYINIAFGSGCFLTLIAMFISLVYKCDIENRFIRKLYSFFSHPVSRMFLSITIASLPNVIVLSIYNGTKIHSNYLYTSAYFTLALFALVGNCLSTTSYSLIKHLSTVFFAVITLWLLMNPMDHIGYYKSNHTSCIRPETSEHDIRRHRLQLHFFFQLLHIFPVIYYLTRENEKKLRINFYATREAEIRNSEAKRAKKVAENLLYNIIPRNVFSQIAQDNIKAQRNVEFSYAHTIPNAGVVFACISNFFASYYREDYKGGEGSLKLLHTIICIFDTLLEKPCYKELEKIKTINDCYMIASGMNSDLNEIENCDDHLIKLMKFAMDIHYNLNVFNEKNIIGSTGFTLKVGYNFGPITAGIIGTSKPLYDIWGDTVNVASRMYSTVSAGNIQVPDYVVESLKHKFSFKYRGEIAVKGKGKMITYLVYKAYGHPHLTVNSVKTDEISPEYIYTPPEVTKT